MAEITVNINGKSYRIGCDPGEEQRVLELGAHIDRHVTHLANAGSVASEAHFLVLAGIMVCDEMMESQKALSKMQQDHDALTQRLVDLQAQIDQLQGENDRLSKNQIDPDADQIDDAAIADVIVNLAGRIETIADKMQKTK